MNYQKITRYNYLYVVLIYLIPFILCLGVANLPLPESIAVFVLLPFMSFLIFGANIVFWFRSKPIIKELKNQGFVSNYTFTARSSVLYIDILHGNIAIASKWNPFKLYVVPAKNITEAKVENFQNNKGNTPSSSAVCFMYVIDGKTYRVYTFQGSHRYPMTSKEIKSGITKATSAVKSLLQAKEMSV